MSNNISCYCEGAGRLAKERDLHEEETEEDLDRGEVSQSKSGSRVKCTMLDVTEGIFYLV